MPPAVEIALATGLTPVSVTGTALISAASSSALIALSDGPAASRSRPIAAGASRVALRRKLDSDCLPRGADRRLHQRVARDVGHQVDSDRGVADLLDGVAQARRQRIDGAAFEPVARDHGFAARASVAMRDGDAFERLALEAAESAPTRQRGSRNWPA